MRDSGRARLSQPKKAEMIPVLWQKLKAVTVFGTN